MVSADKLLYPDLVDIYRNGGDFKNLINFASKKLLKLNFILPSYNKAILKRERQFPTGLMTNSQGVAIPHTDPIHIKKPFIYIIKMDPKLTFGQMGTECKFIDVRYVFLLGIKKSEEQLQLLQSLMKMFMDQDVMNQLTITNQLTEILKIVNNFFTVKQKEIE